MNEFLLLLLSMSLSGTLLALLLFLLRPLLKRNLSRAWMYYIWCIVALRMLLPFAPRQNLVGSLLADPSAAMRQLSALSAFTEDTACLLYTSSYIQKQLKNLEGNHTIFIIAYRISSLKDADQILVLDHGRIAERGTHDELLANNGYYARVFEHQYHTPAKEGR